MPSRPDPGLELLRAVRSPNRIRSSELIARLVECYVPFEQADAALVGGTGWIGGKRVCVLAQQKPAGRSAQATAAVNYGMMTATGYWHVVRQLDRAAAEDLAVVTLIDTPGADPSRGGVERLLAWAISASISAFITTPSPTVSVIIGEGGSGGALALQVADRRLMVSDAIYSVISPESCSAILFREAKDVSKAMKVLRPGAAESLRAGMVDEIVDWPDEVALADHARATELLRARLLTALEAVCATPAPQRLKQRLQRINAPGLMRVDGERAEPGRPRAATDGAAPTGRRPRAGGGGRFSPPSPEQGGGAGELACPPDAGGCGAAFARLAFEQAGWACPSCGLGERISSDQWIRLLCDPGSFREIFAHLDLSDLDDAGYDSEEYRAQRQTLRRELALSEAVRIGFATIQGKRCALAVSDFRFLGGTLGAVYGEKVRLITEHARREHLPLVSVTSSGGARVQEGTLALAQMARTNAAVLQLRQQQLPHVAILADPCTGGALGSFATCATVVLAEPQALIAFAGPRVMKLAGLAVDERMLVSNRAAQYGGIDEVVHRSRLASRVARYLEVSSSIGGQESRPDGLFAPTELMRKDVSRWVSGFIFRMTTLFDEFTALFDRAEVPVGSGSGLFQANVVRQLSDLALVTIPMLLEQAANSREPRVRANAIEALGRFPAYDPAQLHHALADEHHRVRVNAAIALLKRDPEDAAAIEAIRGLLECEDSVSRSAGLFAIIRCPVASLAEWVKKLAAEADEGLRIPAGVALFSLRELHRGREVLGAQLAQQGEEAVAAIGRLVHFLPSSGRKELRRWLQERAAAGPGGGASEHEDRRDE